MSAYSLQDDYRVVRAIRLRAVHYLSPDVAACAGLTLQQLQQFTAGAHDLTDDQLERLARRMRMSEEKR